MSQLVEVTARLLAAYEQFADGNRSINSGEAFKTYCERWGIDYERQMQEARERINAQLAATRARRDRFEVSKRAYAEKTGARASRANSRTRGAVPEFWSWWGDRLDNYPTLDEANAAYRALFSARVQA